MRNVARSCVAPGAVQLLDLFDDGQLEDGLVEAAALRDAAQAPIDGRVRC